MATLLLSVMGAFAEFERALMRERQREGIALAKQRGAYRGRKKALSPEQAEELRKRVTAGEQKAMLAREYGISRETLYQYLKTETELRAPRSFLPPSRPAEMASSRYAARTPSSVVVVNRRTARRSSGR